MIQFLLIAFFIFWYNLVFHSILQLPFCSPLFRQFLAKNQ